MHAPVLMAVITRDIKAEWSNVTDRLLCIISRQNVSDCKVSISSISADLFFCYDPAGSAQFTPLMHMPERAFSWQALGEGACGCRS